MERREKLCTLKNAMDYIKDGSRVAFGGFAIYQKPMAIVHEMIRENKKKLTIVGCVNSMEADLLIGAGAVKCLETSYVGLEKYGLAKNYRRSVQCGAVKVVHYPEMLAWDRFRADREGMPFWPVYFLGGNDVLNDNPEIVPFECPITHKRAYAVPAAKPDVVLIHAYRGDKYGNIQIQERSMLPQYLDVDMARSCKTVIATVEHLVSTEEIMMKPHLTLIPSFKVTAICHVPHGSHPTAVVGAAREDELHLEEYVRMSGSEQGTKEYLQKYILGVESFEEYLKKVGEDRISLLEV